MVNHSPAPSQGSRSDGRIAVRFSDAPGATAPGSPGAVVLGWAEPAPDWAVAVARLPLHVAVGEACGCAGCAPRGAVAEALRLLFFRMAKGEVPGFVGVLVRRPPEEAEATMRDGFVAARFRAER